MFYRSPEITIFNITLFFQFFNDEISEDYLIGGDFILKVFNLSAIIMDFKLL